MSSSSQSLPSIVDVELAQRRIERYVPATPIIYSPLFKQKYGVDVYLKGDGLTPTGSFKLRGAVNALCCLSNEQKKSGVVAFSTGNHAQAVAYSANRLNIPSIIIMPHTAAQVKISNTRAFGAEVVLFDPEKEQREALANSYINERKVTLIHPYDDFNVIAGQGVSGLECCLQLQQLDIVPDEFYLAISGGGYLAGFSLGAEKYFPLAKIIGVEPEVSPPWKISLEKNRATQVLPKCTSICDAIMPPTPKPGVIPWEMLRDRISDIVTVNDNTALIGMACAMKYFGVIAEPSGACGLGEIALKHKELIGKKVVSIISGRNVDQAILSMAVKLIDQV